MVAEGSGGGCSGEFGLRSMQTVTLRMDQQRGPAVPHRGLCVQSLVVEHDGRYHAEVCV